MMGNVCVETAEPVGAFELAAAAAAACCDGGGGGGAACARGAGRLLLRWLWLWRLRRPRLEQRNSADSRLEQRRRRNSACSVLHSQFVRLIDLLSIPTKFIQQFIIQ